MSRCEDAGHLAEDDALPVRRYRCTGAEGERFVLDLCLPCAEELASCGVVLEQEPVLPPKIKAWRESRGRIVLAGWPRSGKSTIANRLEASGIPVLRADALIASHTWSEASAEIALQLAEPGPWCWDGVSCIRAIRKFCEAHPAGERPCDLLVWCRTTYVELTPGQRSMGKGAETILAGIRAELLRRWVEILET